MTRPLPALAALACLPVLLAAARAPDPRTVDYRLSPVMEGDALTALAVEMRFRGDADGRTELDLPDRYASATELWRGVRDLEVEGARSVAEPDPAHRVITAAPGARLVVRYRLVAGSTRELNMQETQPFKLHLTPTWFYGVGEALFAQPHGGEGRPARFDWTGAPEGFAFASDAEHLAGAGGRRATRAGVVGDVLESALLGGRDVKVFTLADSGRAPVRVAARGRYSFNAGEFGALLDATLKEARGFWRDEGEPFLVTLGPVQAPEGAVSLGGSGRTDGFMLSVAGRSPIDLLKYLLEHEYFHTWNARELGGLEGGEREPLGYWFSEGFTDFYTWRLLARSGRITPAEWADSWNTMLRAYAASAQRSRPGGEAAKDFWLDPEAEKLPYQRGALLAAVWDARLRAASGGRTSLDDVLRAQRSAAKRERPVSAAALFPKTAARFGLDVAADLARHVDGGAPILLPRDVFGPCAVVETSERPAFARGWDAEKTTAAGVVTGLDPASPAYAAGLREGMGVVRREAGSPGDATVEYALRVRDGGQERVIRFMPVGPGVITLQQVRLTPGADARTCARSLSGLP